MSENDAEDVREEGSPPESEGVQNSKAKKPNDGSGQKGVLFAGQIEIFADRPLPQFNSGRNKAYKASFKGRNNEKNLVAIICQRQWIPRLESLAQYEKINSPQLVTLVDSGVVFWPADGQERYVLIYKDYHETSLLEVSSDAALGWKSDEVVDYFVKPMISVFQSFQEKGFVHGAISPLNMFLSGAGKNKSLVLGDCLSLPPSYTQTALYEPIERAMADPVGRGRGTLADDLYSFGVTIMVLLRSSDPLKGLSDEEIIRQKLELGSYTALVGKERFKGDVLELLRGLLHDDPAQRWTFEELLVWGDGRRLSPKQSLVRKKASRPFVFLEKKFLYLQSLAMFMDKNPVETKKIIEDETLQQWLDRAVGDTNTVERVEEAIQLCKDAGTGSGYPDRLASVMSATLDTFAPIRYKSMSLFPESMGAVLFEAVAMKKDLSPYADLILKNIIAKWLGYHENSHVDISTAFSKIEQCKRFLRGKGIAEGLERCLYYLAPDAPCMSEALDKYVVMNPKALLLAFEDMCAQGKVPTLFLDRHIVSFLMERDSRAVEFCMYDLNSGSMSKIILANLRCLAEIQTRYDVKSVPALSKAFAEKMESVYELYHDRQARETLKKGVAEHAQSGDLRKMLRLFDNKELLDKDIKGFKLAVYEYRKLFNEGEVLQSAMEDKDSYGLDTAREWTAIASGVLAVIVVIGAILTLFSG